MKVKHYMGEEELNIGDRFKFSTGDSWEIVRRQGGFYSPSNIGETPSFACRSLDKRMPGWMEQYKQEDGTVVFCGDSIASAMSGKHGGARLTPESRSES